MKQETVQISRTNRAELIKRGKLLEYFTIGWNLLEGAVAIGAGTLAGSPSLVGFGLDSFIESTSGAALLWRLQVDDEETRERREQIALRLVGASFLALAAYGRLRFDNLSDLARNAGFEFYRHHFTGNFAYRNADSGAKQKKRGETNKKPRT